MAVVLPVLLPAVFILAVAYAVMAPLATSRRRDGGMKRLDSAGAKASSVDMERAGHSAADSGGTSMGKGILAFLGVFYIIAQQHYGVVERFGRFHRIMGPGLHAKFPIVDKVRDVSLMTEDEHMRFDAKTKDNVTIGLEVSIQFMVDDADAVDVYHSGVYRSLYTLSDPVGQMRDYFADALRSQIPSRSLDAVFAEKDEIAEAIGGVVGERMRGYGYIVVTTLITSIILPEDVQASMNRIVASKNDLESANNEAEADKVRTVRAAEAKADAMRIEGEGIASQRKAIAEGLAASIDVVTASGLASAEANALLMFTQNIGMLEKFAEDGGTKTLVLPAEMAQGNLIGQVMAAAEGRRDVAGGSIVSGG